MSHKELLIQARDALASRCGTNADERKPGGLLESMQTAIDAPELRRLHAANVDLFQELKNIAEANPLNWDAPMNDTASFRAWAQNRARAAIEKHGGQQCAASPTST